MSEEFSFCWLFLRVMMDLVLNNIMSSRLRMDSLLADTSFFQRSGNKFVKIHFMTENKLPLFTCL